MPDPNVKYDLTLSQHASCVQENVQGKKLDI